LTSPPSSRRFAAVASIVVGLSLLLLMLVFRSLIVPVKAAIGFLLSVGASFGATVAVFQWAGWPDRSASPPGRWPVSCPSC